jgi:hypothetical protein
LVWSFLKNIISKFCKCGLLCFANFSLSERTACFNQKSLKKNKSLLFKLRVVAVYKSLTVGHFGFLWFIPFAKQETAFEGSSTLQFANRFNCSQYFCFYRQAQRLTIGQVSLLFLKGFSGQYGLALFNSSFKIITAFVCKCGL